MNEQNNGQLSTRQRPTTNDPGAWKIYWRAQGQPWRTEPEIDTERQKYLNERRTVAPNIEQGIYPFRDVKLSRADVEWLLTTHESGGMCGPVDWYDEHQRKRQGLDLRGANLSQEDYSKLPLTCMQGALKGEEWVSITEEQRNIAAVCMEKAILVQAQLQGADLWQAQLQKANLRGARLQEAYLWQAQLQGAILRHAQLQGTKLGGAQLQEAILYEAQLQKVDLWQAQLQKANLRGAQLQEAILYEAQLQGANLWHAQLQGADLRRANLEDVTLDQVTLSDEKYGAALLADINWGNVNLAVVDWEHLPTLGDEQVARQKTDNEGKKKDKQMRIYKYKEAVRANRQLAVVLREQGLNEEADHFAYRAQKLQRIVLRRQRKFGRYLFLGFLDLLAGYGYRPGRSVIWYLTIVCGFALTYHIFGHLSLFPPDAFIYSLTSFHGRGFFPGLEHRTSLHDPLIMLAAIEAVLGLFIEISFIATFTQRFFGR